MQPVLRHPMHAPVRMCAVLRTCYPSSMMIRFGLARDVKTRQVFAVPFACARARFSHRGAYLLCYRPVVEYAIKQNAFSSAFRQKVAPIPNLSFWIEDYLKSHDPDRMHKLYLGIDVSLDDASLWKVIPSPTEFSPLPDNSLR
ncbi:mitochondrial putative RNA-binding protein YlxR [Andalucia godoyi]|uniref:Mitochondrial putative RNA-binding protein YlxR n=1 Tax=Andalucia godoyi TaxID=505711 RepID=A0A8K0AI96_ANDGO|nr:mitochondrial putative RNA-binding protein YlxR [Andalucia godoyi]|eukprot:ANDGO_01129.mRNA.1 mitochondrial putative RNA-binding protein YlxR